VILRCMHKKLVIFYHLNLIIFFDITFIAVLIMYSTGDGVNTSTERFIKKGFRKQRVLYVSALTPAHVDVIHHFFKCSWRFMDAY
jgi:hypothetical protein